MFTSSKPKNQNEPVEPAELDVRHQQYHDDKFSKNYHQHRRVTNVNQAEGGQNRGENQASRGDDQSYQHRGQQHQGGDLNNESPSGHRVVIDKTKRGGHGQHRGGDRDNRDHRGGGDRDNRDHRGGGNQQRKQWNSQQTPAADEENKGESQAVAGEAGVEGQDDKYFYDGQKRGGGGNRGGHKKDYDGNRRGGNRQGGQRRDNKERENRDNREDKNESGKNWERSAQQQKQQTPEDAPKQDGHQEKGGDHHQRREDGAENSERGGHGGRGGRGERGDRRRNDNRKGGKPRRYNEEGGGSGAPSDKQ